MRLRVDVSKNFSTAESSQDGEFDTSTTTEAPFSTSASPSPVTVLTPDLGAAATASCPCSRSFSTSLDPMSPVPPITTIFIMISSALHGRAGVMVIRKADRVVASPETCINPVLCDNQAVSSVLEACQAQSAYVFTICCWNH